MSASPACGSSASIRSKPPPGPFREDFWRSPLRGPWLTAVLGLVLLIGLPIVIVTGLLSNDAYQPGLGANALGRDIGGPLDFYLFAWPTHPSWLYALTQGLHVSIGLALFPVLLAKLWSVIPRLFEWPPVRNPAHALERLSLALLVGSALFEFVTGILNIQYWYAFQFFFTPAHYYGAWVFIGAFLAHVTLKFGTMRQSLRTRAEVLEAARAREDVGSRVRPRRSLAARRGPRARDDVAPRAARNGRGGIGPAAGCKAPPNPSAVRSARWRSCSRADASARARSASRSTRRRSRPVSPLTSIGAGWRLHLVGERFVSLSREQLLALPQHTYELPIACVEGWSTTQRWTGVRLRDLASLCGVHRASHSHHPVARTRHSSATRRWVTSRSPTSARCWRCASTASTCRLDHGYPARVISPALPGVHCTKWVSHMTFRPVPE